jgi:carbonic anhydrase
MYRARDRWNNTIELTDERWQYIVRWHPDLEDHLDDVLQTVKRGRRRQAPVDANKYIYYRRTDELWPEYNHIIVVVKLVRNNFVITAYPKFIDR